MNEMWVQDECFEGDRLMSAQELHWSKSDYCNY